MTQSWTYIFENYKLACYELYKWNVNSKGVSFSDFDERLFYKSLIEKSFMNNEERVLEFFDHSMIYCYIIPNGYQRYITLTESEFRHIVCHDHQTRREASLRVLENAFSLLQERLIHEKKEKDAEKMATLAT